MNIRQHKTARAGVGLVSVMTVGAMLLNAMPAAAVDFSHPAFKRVWDRTDSLVASGQVSRTFFWGPEPRSTAQEQYLDAPGGTSTRLVQYFDKSRMEINNPNADPNAVFFVTNGLLTIELISGQMQIGDNAFVNRYSANIPISGDTDDAQAPTYASFLSVANSRRGDHPQPDRRGQFATGTINKAGEVGEDPSKATVAGTRIAYFEPSTRHNIPDIFWQFLNATGPISETGQIVNKRLIDPWFYASGFPVSDAYWSRVKIKGEMQDVMIQAYERRVLTYVPTNIPGFQVEMGNIGLHYFDWRYKDAGKPTGTITTTPGTPAPTGTAGTTTAVPTGTAGTATAGPSNTPGPSATGTPPTATPTVTATPNVISQGVIAFSSERTGNKDIWRIKGDGTSPANLTANSPKHDDYPSYSPDRTKIVFTSERDGNQEIYVMNADGSGVTRLTNSPGRDYDASWSPDGTKIVFVSERNDTLPDIFTMNANGTGQVNISQSAGEDTSPSWGATGRIVFASKRSGANQIYTMNPDGTSVSAALTTSGTNFLPKWSPSANRIVFVSTRDGQNEIYIMGSGGQDQTRLTSNTADDWDSAFSPDGTRIVFSSARVAADNLELYIMSVDGSNQERITIQTGIDTHPSWSIGP